MGRKNIAEAPANYTQINLADALFPGIRQRVLGYLFGQPERSFYASELIQLVGGGSGAVQRELARLEGSGLVQVTYRGTQKHYQANPDSPIYSELCGIADKALPSQPRGGAHGAVVSDRNKEEVLYIAGSLPVPRRALVALAERYHIKRLSLFGSAARGELRADSDIDVLVEFQTDKAPSLGGLSALQEELSALFEGRKVDVATPAILNNPYRRREIEKDMEVLYAA